MEDQVFLSEINKDYAMHKSWNGFHIDFKGVATPPCDCPRDVVLELLFAADYGDLYGYIEGPKQCIA